MVNIWKRLEAWYKDNAPEVLTDLLPGATVKDLNALDESLGMTLPKSFKSAYAVHDGQTGIAAPAFVDWGLLSSKSIQKQWALMKKLLEQGALDADGVAVGPVRSVWWSQRWVPIAANGMGDFQCLDLDPQKGGKTGQVITFLHMDGKRQVEAISLEAWMEGYAKDFEAGLYELENDMLVRARAKR